MYSNNKLGIPSIINGKTNPAWSRAWYRANKERVAVYHSIRQKAGLKTKSCSIYYRPMVISLLRQRDGDNCGICGLYVDDKVASVDHIKLRAFGGLDTADNIRLTHLTCNLQRPRSDQ